MNIQQVEIKTILGKDEYIFTQLKADLNVVLKAEKNLIIAYTAFANNLKTKIFPKEYIEAMKQIFLDTANQYENITKKRQDLVRLSELVCRCTNGCFEIMKVNLIDTKMLPSLNSYISEVKEIKSTLNEYEKKQISADNKL